MKPSIAVTFLPCITSALLLFGCGGNTASATIGGIVTGLLGGTTLSLANNGIDPITVTANGPFTFGSGSTFSVTVVTQPLGQTCTVTGGSGTVGVNGEKGTNVAVNC